MTAQLNVQFTDPPAPGDPNRDAVVYAVNGAFDEWARHFDYTAGVFTINVSFRALIQPADVSLNVDDFTRVASDPRLISIVEPSFGLSFAARAASPAVSGTPTLYVNPANFNGGVFSPNGVAPIERELGHALGIAQLRAGNVVRGPLLQTQATVYDTSLLFVQPPPNAVTTFDGPYAEAVYGGPVPVDNANTNITTVGGGLAVDTTTQGASTVQPLDVALLRDAGLPALSDRELQEHEIARLYFAAFGRTADSGGLILQLNVLRADPVTYDIGGQQQIANSLVSSPEFAARYGTLSNADFVRTVYQNALGRQPDAVELNSYLTQLAMVQRFAVTRGTILYEIAESDEARGRLSANPNVTYAATAEAQVARLYDTALGRYADPAGFNTFTSEIVNGTTLQQTALAFLSSPEFANRYGAAPPDQALVDALYQNTLAPRARCGRGGALRPGAGVRAARPGGAAGGVLRQHRAYRPDGPNGRRAERGGPLCGRLAASRHRPGARRHGRLTPRVRVPGRRRRGAGRRPAVRRGCNRGISRPGRAG